MKTAPTRVFKKQISAVQEVARVSPVFLRSIREKLTSIADWSTVRASKFQVHAQTRSIELIQSPLTGDFYRQIERGTYFDRFTPELVELEQTLSARYGFVDPGICRCLIVALPAGGSVKPHQDFGAGLMVGARIHLPIQTNSDVLFHVDGVSEHLQEGRLYEIDNSALHAVANGGATHRIHLILDICDMHGIEDQVHYVDECVSENSQDLTMPDQNREALRFCGGRIQERLLQSRPPTHLFVLAAQTSAGDAFGRWLGTQKGVLVCDGDTADASVRDYCRGRRAEFSTLFTEDADLFCDPEIYDWPKIKSVWYQQWDAKPDVRAVVATSPANLLRVPMLRRQFPNPKFVIFVQNPHQTIEELGHSTGITDLQRLAKHVNHILKTQATLLKRLGNRACLVRREDLTRDLDATIERVARFLPELDFQTMAGRPIKFPTPSDGSKSFNTFSRASIKTVLDPDLLNRFGYGPDL